MIDNAAMPIATDKPESGNLPDIVETKRKLGRPTTYKPEYVEALKGLGAQGLSITQMAVAIGVPRTTMLQWADPSNSRYAGLDFEMAYARELESAEAHYDSLAYAGLNDRSFQANLWQFLVANRYGSRYSARPELATGNVAIQINLVGTPEAELL